MRQVRRTPPCLTMVRDSYILSPNLLMAQATATQAKPRWYITLDKMRDGDTFRFRHAIYQDKADGEPFCVAQDLDEGVARFMVMAWNYFK